MDRLLVLALQIYEDSLCTGCGQLLSECTDADLEDHWTTLPLATRCYACTALARRAREYEGVQHAHALRFTPGVDPKGAAIIAARREAQEQALDEMPEHPEP